jgi:hypothetical protein
VFVPNLPAFLIAIFKNRSGSLNRKEIHTEIMYRRIFDDKKFSDVVGFFIDKL